MKWHGLFNEPKIIQEESPIYVTKPSDTSISNEFEVKCFKILSSKSKRAQIDKIKITEKWSGNLQRKYHNYILSQKAIRSKLQY